MEQRKVKEANPIPLQYSVKPFLSFIAFTNRLRVLIRVQYTSLEILLCIAYKHYTNGKGCTVSYLCRTLYNDFNGALSRSVRYRLDTLQRHDLIYRVEIKGYFVYYLSDKAKSILEEVNKAK